jgi:ERCC4-related helicase
MSSQFFEHPLIKKNTIERRFYQEAIFASSINKNTLVVLPTGLGKTLIAALVLAYRLQKFEASRCIFLAPTRPLVMQHYQTLKSVLNLTEDKFVVMTGEISPEKRINLWKQGKIIFTTPQILENDLIFNRTEINGVSLIIFDEAHRAVGDYPYPHIAKLYVTKSLNPLILALTASPGSSTEKIKEVCNNLYISNIESRTDKSIDVKPYLVTTEIEWVKVELPESIAEIKKVIEAILNDQRRFLVKNNFLPPNSGRYLSKKALLELQATIRRSIDRDSSKSYLLLNASSIAAEAFRLSHALDLLETQGLIPLDKYFTKLEKESTRSGSPRAVKNLLANPKIMNIRDKIKQLIDQKIKHPKINYTINLINTRFSKKVDSRIIVFTQYRDSALELTKELNEQKKVKAKRFVGQASRESDKGISQKNQLDLLKDFREGRINVLVATSVAEEGLDIHECDLVLFYDFSPSVIRYIQRKGRTGRKYPGSVIILLTKDTRDESYYYIMSRKEKKIDYAIKTMAVSDKIKSIPASQNRLEKFITKSNSNQIEIVVDTREAGSQIVRELSKLEVNIIPSQLSVGDYLISNLVAIERKTTDDFLQSLIDKRLFNQMISLKKNYEIPILIIEGSSLYGIRNIHPNAIRGALASIAIDYSIPILWSTSSEETAKLIYSLAIREQKDKKRTISLKKTKLGTSIKEMQETLLSSLPQVNLALSRRLLNKFKTPSKIFTSDIDKLTEVEGVGKIKAKKIKEVLDTEYPD